MFVYWIAMADMQILLIHNSTTQIVYKAHMLSSTVAANFTHGTKTQKGGTAAQPNNKSNNKSKKIVWCSKHSIFRTCVQQSVKPLKC